MTYDHQDIHPLLRKRASSRVYNPGHPVPSEAITLLLEAARWSPSSGNGQPWRYLVFDDRVPEAREVARAILDPGNGVWASQAPVLILGIAKEVRSGGRANAYGQHDLGLANQSLLLQATALGLHCRPMGGFDKEQAVERFHIPEGHRPMVMIAVGYPGELELLSDDVQEKERVTRTRRPLGEFAYHGDWDQPFPGEPAADGARSV